jgi:hypothetical protein
VSVKNLSMVNANKDNVVHIHMINQRSRLVRNFKQLVLVLMEKDVILVMI